MAKIVNLQELVKEVESIRKTRRLIVLVGGCFDILHIGHIKFLKEAKKSGDCLMVLLESDETVQRLKGDNKPYFPQKDRAEVLSSIKYVDYVIMLLPITNDEDYEKLTKRINPDIIAATENDPIIGEKKRQAELVGGKLKIIPYAETFSSSKLAKLLGVE